VPGWLLCRLQIRYYFLKVLKTKGTVLCRTGKGGVSDLLRANSKNGAQQIFFVAQEIQKRCAGNFFCCAAVSEMLRSVFQHNKK
jgi:hypothetical protein